MTIENPYPDPPASGGGLLPNRAGDQERAHRRALHLAWAEGYDAGTIDAAKAHLAVERDLERLREALTTDATWLARLARGSSWPGEMAQRVEDAADRISALATPEADR